MGTPQRFTGTPDTVAPGQLFPIKFTNPDLANTTTTVTVVYEDGSTKDVKVTLDAQGKGSTDFTAPSTPQALTLTHPTSADFGIVVNNAPSARSTKASKKKTPNNRPSR